MQDCHCCCAEGIGRISFSARLDFLFDSQPQPQLSFKVSYIRGRELRASGACTWHTCRLSRSWVLRGTDVETMGTGYALAGVAAAGGLLLTTF